MKNGHNHIYIVDDDEEYRKALKRLLSSAGYFAECFPSARSFLDSVPVDAKGYLLLDLRMPDMDGFQLQQKLKELHYNLKIIIITAHAQSGDREYLLDQGAYAFLMKPFDDESLLELINANFQNEGENL